MLSLQGEAFAARVSASLLKAAGLPELVTQTLGDYEAMALRLAREPELLQGLQTRLKNNRASMPLFDGMRFCRNIEAAFVAMHK